MDRRTAAPPTWWRPPLAMTWLLDVVVGDSRPPVGIIAASPAPLLPALIRLPSARCLTFRPWGTADLALLPAVAAFVGRQPVVESLATIPPASLQTVLWCAPSLSCSTALVHQIGACLAPSGMLAIFGTPAVEPAAMPSLIHLRRTLRRAGLRVERTDGCLGPRALAWSACARLALAAGRPERYDRYHAAMRAAFAEPWPWALACRHVVVVARNVPC